IDNGVQSGKLTRHKADRLYNQERKINELEAQLRSSGNKLSSKEEQNLLNRMETLSKEVGRQLNDWQVR
ncbi:MAG: hypothetical protein K8F91_02370, partial [Candidatus Obscuribacterales bacterium]|nr:hypothetical protein [Candidatus Obscuribacterales bacterium]